MTGTVIPKLSNCVFSTMLRTPCVNPAALAREPHDAPQQAEFCRRCGATIHDKTQAARRALCPVQVVAGNTQASAAAGWRPLAYGERRHTANGGTRRDRLRRTAAHGETAAHGGTRRDRVFFRPAPTATRPYPGGRRCGDGRTQGPRHHTKQHGYAHRQAFDTLVGPCAAQGHARGFPKPCQCKQAEPCAPSKSICSMAMGSSTSRFRATTRRGATA